MMPSDHGATFYSRRKTGGAKRHFKLEEIYEGGLMIYPAVKVRGRGAFIYLPAEDAQIMGIIGAAVNGQYIRWLPYLDGALKESMNVEELFTAPGTATRHIVARQNLSTLRCIGCGDFLHIPAYGPCPMCAGQLCHACFSDGRQKYHLEVKCLSGV